MKPFDIEGLFMIHVAILMRPYVEMVLSGEKTIESRLTKTARAPYGVIERGERIYFKQSAGPFRATAVVDQVLFVDELTPRRVSELKRVYNEGICGDDGFWDWKRDSCFASLMWLRDVEEISYGPDVKPQRGIAWIVLDEREDVYPECLGEREEDFERLRYDDEVGRNSAAGMMPTGLVVVTLTGGNIRNSHVRVPREALDFFPKAAFGGATRAEEAERLLLLELENGGGVIRTDIVAGKGIFRARRGWRTWFAETGAEAGDQVLFFPLGEARYLVRLHKQRSS